MKFCAKLVEFTKKIIFSEEFLARHRLHGTDFTRQRKMPFAHLLIFLMNQVRASLGTELNRFFKVIEETDLPAHRMTGSALCQGRKKLRWEAFVELCHEVVNWFYDYGEVKRWMGYRLVAIDGSTCRPPNTAGNRRHFGEASGGIGDPVAMGRISFAFDVLNDVVLDAHLGPYGCGERSLGVGHLDWLRREDLVLLDRGYVATWLLHLLQVRGQAFCCRVDPNQYLATKAFRDSGQRDGRVVLPPSREGREMYEQLGLPFEAIRVRIVRVVLPSGGQIFLLTSLGWSVEILGELYRERWPVEEQYKLVKCRLEIERFSGVSTQRVYQDFHARVFTVNLTSMLSFSARREIEETQGDRRHPRRINWTSILGTMKDSLVLLFVRDSIKDILEGLIELFRLAWQTFRPGRNFPRPKRRKKGVFSPGYKPAY